MVDSIRDLDVHAGAHARTKVAGTRGEVSVGVEALKADGLVQLVHHAAQAFEHGTDVPSLLHADDTEMVLLVHPHQEGLLIVEEDAAAFGPVPGEASSLHEAISLLEQEMLLDEPVLGFLLHAQQGIVLAGQVTSQGVQ